MSCLNPIFIRSKALNSPVGSLMSVRCGKCVGCLRDRQNTWIYRLQRARSEFKYSYFVTLTYDEKNVPLRIVADVQKQFDELDSIVLDSRDRDNIRMMLLKYRKDENDSQFVRYVDYVKSKGFYDVVMSLYPLDLTNYFKRLRKSLGFEVKYYSCGEYGDQFNRPHYHFIMFSNVRIQPQIESAWHFGIVDVKPVTDSRISYVTKYIMKYGLESPPSEFSVPCFQRNSNGLGKMGFLKDLKFDDEAKDSVQLNNGSRLPTPRYYRKLFFADRVFDYNKQKLIEYEQRKKEKQDFELFYQDYKLHGGQLAPEEIKPSYIQNRSDTEQRQLANITHLRRKGM